MDLKTARFLKRFSQYDIALKTGIQQSRISLLERGYVRPKEEEIRRLAKVLNCKGEELFPMEGNS